MRKKGNKKINFRYFSNNKMKLWHKFLTVLSVIIVFITTYVLIMPALTKEEQVFCGFEEHLEHTEEDGCYKEEKVLVCTLPEETHTHTDECYELKKTLICTLEETDGHIHDDSCYTDNTYLACGLEETDGHIHSDDCYEEISYLICENDDPEHVHDDSCYHVEYNLVCGLEECEPHHHDDSCMVTEHILTCGLEECEPHHHDDSCYYTEKVLTCGLDETPVHTHTDECYEIKKELVCTKPIHQHTLQCFSDTNADVETRDIWERTLDSAYYTEEWGSNIAAVAATQIGYKESEKNYKVQEDGSTIKGYTRYGAWYGDGYEYNDWDAMFAAFCISYAGIPANQVAQWDNPSDWAAYLYNYNLMESAYGYIPEPGDLVFFDTDYDGYADHMGIVSSADVEERTEEVAVIPENVEDDAVTALEDGADTALNDDTDTEVDADAAVNDDTDTKDDADAAVNDDTDTKVDPDAAESTVQTVRILRSFYAIEGDHNNTVKKELYYEGDSSIVGFMHIPENPALNKEPLKQESEIPDEAAETETEEAETKETEATEAETTEQETEEAETEETEAIEAETETTEQATVAEDMLSDHTEPATDDSSITETNEEQTIESEPASDGAVAVISGQLPENAIATIEAVTLTEDELIAYFGKEKAASMKSFVAYDIKIMVDEEEWQPDETVSVTVRQPEIEASEKDGFSVAHVDSETNEIEELEGIIDESGEISFDTDGFSLYIFYTFTVDFYYYDTVFSLSGYGNVFLSELLVKLGIEGNVSDIINAYFSDDSLVTIEPVYAEDGVTIIDWFLTSLESFDSIETLTLEFADGEVVVIDVMDPPADGGRDSSPPNYIPTIGDTLATQGPNDWQIVVHGFEGAGVEEKTGFDLDGFNTASPGDFLNQPDGDTDVWIQKNVVPTSVENEFLVYLSISRPVTFEDLFRQCHIGIASNNNGDGFGEFSSKEPGGYKGGVGEEIPAPVPGAVYAVIDIYESTHLEGSGNTAYWVGDGDLLGRFIGWRDCPGNVSCSNGSIYLEMYLNGTKQYLKLANQTTLKTSENQGTGNPFHPIISYAQLHNAGIDLSLARTELEKVVDIIGDNMEYIPNSAEDYCDGTFEPDPTDPTGKTMIWTPVEKETSYDLTYTTNPASLSGSYNNIAELVYKVRLKTETKATETTEGFHSCADNMHSAENDPESYKVNESAVLDYHMASLAGANPAYTSNTHQATFDVPRVRGLLYDLWFLKVNEDDFPLPGAEFKILDKNQVPLKDGYGNDIIYRSDNNGFVGLFDLPCGEYTGINYIQETNPPIFYDLPDNPIWDTKLSYTNDKTAFTSDVLNDKPENMRLSAYSGETDPWKIVNTKTPGKPVILKKVNPDNEPLEGVKFDLYGSHAVAGGGVEKDTDPITGYTNLTSDAAGIFLNKELPNGTYYLTEIETLEGYKLLEQDLVLVVSDSGVSAALGGEPLTVIGTSTYTVSVPNEFDTVELTVKKIVLPEDAASGTFPFTAELEEGEFPEPKDGSGYTIDGAGVAHFELGHNGTVKLAVLPNSKVTVTETSHAGFTTMASIVGMTGNTAGDSIEVEILTDPVEVDFTNTAGVELPHTGGSGTLLYSLAGLCLMLAAVLAFMLKAKKRTDR